MTSAAAPQTSWLDEIPARLADIERAHLLRRRRVVQPASGARLLVDGRPMLAFCSNDYLGLAGHPALAEATREATHHYGVGSGGSPLVSGHSAANDALEHDLAAYVQLPRALYFYAGYATNTGIIPALVGDGDALFSDALNHACLIDGARLSRATIHRYPHADLAALEAQLAASPARRKLVISDAVFSMDGDLIDIPALLALCERYDALLLLDDAHGFGVLGPQGRGSLAQAGLTGPTPRAACCTWPRWARQRAWRALLWPAMQPSSNGCCKKRAPTSLPPPRHRCWQAHCAKACSSWRKPTTGARTWTDSSRNCAKACPHCLHRWAGTCCRRTPPCRP